MLSDCTIALAITLLGVSAEIYTYGTQFIVINIAYIIGNLPTTSREKYMLTVFFILRYTYSGICVFARFLPAQIDQHLPGTARSSNDLFICFDSLLVVSRNAFQSFCENFCFFYIYGANDLLHGYCSLRTGISPECSDGHLQMDVNHFGGRRVHCLLHHWWH